MAVFPTGTTWNHLEPVGSSWNHLDPVGIWLGLVPVEPTGNSLSTGIQVENLEGVPCLFGRYPTQKILVGIHLVPTGSGRNLWGTVKTSKSGQLFPQSEHIHATAMVSQRLVEGFWQNSQPADHGKHILPHLHNFHLVFSKDSFDELPGTKLWDHAIKLLPNAILKSCKVYLLSDSEQKELNAFLKENFESGWIWPSKSLMAAPVFFIKKKDGKLHLVQDYHTLNAMTMKNKYLLPLILELIVKLCGAKYFTKLDIWWGFNNVRIKEGDEWKAAFQTNHSLYELLQSHEQSCHLPDNNGWYLWRPHLGRHSRGLSGWHSHLHGDPTVRPKGWENFTFNFNRNGCEFQQFSMDFPTIYVQVNTIKSIDLCWNF